ncbi:ArsR/SmtB family transcription factor [Deinococcus radiophilus]|uniref:ArsR family transcriptional regulator n=1 Tax=Deinococcus radiophilus TaxID=32062 RepID=A0A3S0JP82_9DEIO|nr:metalloregulator ArsR/SmtB family transcription factor [Deinococcus radiophilus]RTR26118.1 ArsR family transcriptional regulator [Deinococcus radiophilus]UFA51598.1 metalloregulator ArsR/SmtB family transcription factor [Deinococcus radiophilus]
MTESPTEVCGVRCVHPAAVHTARQSMPDEEALSASAALFKLLGEPGRLRLLLVLQGGELCVCDLAAVTGASESSVSHSLQLLRAHRAVRPRKEGRNVYYALHDTHVSNLLNTMTAHMLESDEDGS